MIMFLILLDLIINMLKIKIKIIPIKVSIAFCIPKKKNIPILANIPRTKSVINLSSKKILVVLLISISSFKKYISEPSPIFPGISEPTAQL